MTETTAISEHDVELYEWLVDNGYTSSAARLLLTSDTVRGVWERSTAAERVSIRTRGGETIISSETKRRSYVGHSNGHNNGTSWVIGPVLVDVVEYVHVSNTRPTLHDTYAVEIDRRHQCGGPLRFLDEDDDGTPLLSWTQLVSIDA